MLDADLVQCPVLKYLERINLQKNTTVSPIEMVIPTFIGNRTDITVERKNFRFIDWENAVDLHPNTLNMKHWNRIRNSNAHFARKFQPVESNELVERIDREMLKS